MKLQLKLLKRAGFTSVRDDIYWSNVEPAPGHLHVPEASVNMVDAMVESGLSPLLVLAYGNKAYDHADKPRSK